MPPSPLSTLFLLLLLVLFLSPTASTPTRRRSLQQSFFPQAASPSPTPPSPYAPSPTSTPDQTPFFPSISSPPPPPRPSPPPSSATSVPANISSLALPHSPKPTTSLASILFLTASAAVLLAAVALFPYLRRRRHRNFNDAKTSTTRSDSSLRVFSRPSGPPRRVGRSPPTSSEFLLLGTIVDSRGGVNPLVAPAESSRKPDSPELRPLPPLGHRKNRPNAEEDVFFSPGEFSGVRESSNGTRSAAAAENLEGSSSESSSSTSSYSTRSVSLSTSPPVSLSPISSRPKSPELTAVQTAPPPPPQQQPVTTQLANLRRDLEESLESSPRTSNASFSNAEESPVRVYNVVWSRLGRSSRGKNTSSDSSSSNLMENTELVSNAGSSNQNPESLHFVSNPIYQDMESSTRLENSIRKPVPVSAAPPPPPRPPLPPGVGKERLVSSSSISQPILKPPGLITPLKPPLVSPIELSANPESVGKNKETQKPKLKPLHWDKVRASSGCEMVWDQLNSSSFRLNEEMIESLLVVDAPKSKSKESTGRPVLPSPNQETRVLDPKKAQNIAISLRALNVTTDQVCEALSEGNALGTELLESLLKMVPTKDEERRLKEHKDDSPFKLGPAERFLKAMLDVPFAFKRVDAMLYRANFESDVAYLRKSFEILEAACEELRNSRMFLKLLEAVLKTGNRMNKGTRRGDAHAFKLDTLLRLVDVKGADGKTTLLHFVVQEMIRTEGGLFSGGNQYPNTTTDADAKCRKVGLKVVSSLSSELRNVKKAAAMDSDMLIGDVVKLSKGIENIQEIAQLEEERGLNKSTGKFSESMKRFTRTAEDQICRVQALKNVALSLVKEITEFFHGCSAKEEAHPFRIFTVVTDFLTILDRVCSEVGMINERTVISSTHKFPLPVNPLLQPVNSGFPRRRNYSSFDDDDYEGSSS
ncbi:hypothetical protein RHSIM_Rhsim13G0055100 [Rhododendron simsii]|uniref:Formin-like protein n=1 Tax=Rhododendron simsii TaxID=118357 RepID=A0A834FZT3_RHOSS|nr:hypothetical protein RHSIM_Rhsim13G0055100 [Rhododendron simsii]